MSEQRQARIGRIWMSPCVRVHHRAAHLVREECQSLRVDLEHLLSIDIDRLYILTRELLKRCIQRSGRGEHVLEVERRRRRFRRSGEPSTRHDGRHARRERRTRKRTTRGERLRIQRTRNERTTTTTKSDTHDKVITHGGLAVRRSDGQWPTKASLTRRHIAPYNVTLCRRSDHDGRQSRSGGVVWRRWNCRGNRQIF
jgi:hypothetical protein